MCGFDPLRLDTADRGVEGIRHYSHLHGLMPRLGFFVGQRSAAAVRFRRGAGAGRIPSGARSSRPTHDRYARIADVRAEVAAVPGVTLETPMDFNRFGRKFQARVLDWLAETNR